MAHSRRFLFLLSIFVLSVAVRIVTAEYVENGGDCTGVWFNVRMLVEGLGVPEWNHHNMRWGTVLPLWGFTKLFGTHPSLYYVVPILFASVAAVLVCLVGERLHSLKVGILAAVLFIFYPQMTQTGSQIWPSIFEMTYLLACFLLILSWIESRSSYLLLLAAVAFFFGWGSRVTAVYFLPGLLLLIWLPTRDFKALLLFCCSVGALCLGELAWFWWDTGNPLGRVGILMGSHVSKDELLISGKDYLFHFAKLTKLKGLLGVALAILIACVGLLRARDQRLKALAAVYVFHFLLEVWMVSSISPLKMAQPIGARYNCVVVPFGLLALCIACLRLGKKRPLLAKSVFALLLVVFVLFSAKRIPMENSFVQTNHDYGLMQRAVAEDIPVVMQFTPWSPNLVEKKIIELFNGKVRRKDISDFESSRVMTKNKGRMAALYIDDIAFAGQLRRTNPLKLSKYVYLFDPYMEKVYPEAAEVLLVGFGRKHCGISLVKYSDIQSALD